MYKLTVFTDITRNKKHLQYNFMKNKEILRQWAKTHRQSAIFAETNYKIVYNLANFKIFKNAKNVMLFYPLKYEVNLLDLLNIDNKTYCFPSLVNNKIIPYLNNNNFISGKFKIFEPKNSVTQNINELDLVIVPALCVDQKGNRIGYGKGYYDKFLKNLNRNKTKVLVAIWDDFIIEEINPDIFDEKIDFIVSETKIISI